MRLPVLDYALACMLLIGACCLRPSRGWAMPNHPLDSLRQELTKAQEDTHRVQLLNKLHELAGWRMHQHDTVFDHIIERHGLKKIETIGDAYSAVCGLPNVHPQHAQTTVQAALEISDFLQKRNKQVYSFQIRIGIHSGSMAAGIGGVKKFAYDIWGDTVHTAARMEQRAEIIKINILNNDHQFIKDYFQCTCRGKVIAKGKGDIDMYFVELKEEYMVAKK